MTGRLLVVGLLSCGMAMAQAAPAPAVAGKPMAFDVVSIRQNMADQGPGLPQFGPTQDGYRMINMQLFLPILTAYIPQTQGTASFTPDQLIGLPDWVMRDRFDIEAKVSGEDLEEWQKPASQSAMLQAMLQSLLADRCKLVVHREVKEVAVYSLVVAKGGPKFKETNPDEAHPDGITLPWGGVLVPAGRGMHLYGATMKSFATLLSQVGGGPLMHRTIQDNTGLTAKYDILLQVPDMGPPPGAQTGGAGAASDPFDMLHSMVEGLGLKLESTKAPVETLVIDHMEKPSEN